MTPTCKELIEFLDDYVAGELASDRVAGFEARKICPVKIHVDESGAVQESIPQAGAAKV